MSVHMCVWLCVFHNEPKREKACLEISLLFIIYLFLISWLGIGKPYLLPHKLLRDLMKYINDNKIQKQRKGEREMGGGG